MESDTRDVTDWLDRLEAFLDEHEDVVVEGELDQLERSLEASNVSDNLALVLII